MTVGPGEETRDGMIVADLDERFEGRGRGLDILVIEQVAKRWNRLAATHLGQYPSCADPDLTLLVGQRLDVPGGGRIFVLVMIMIVPLDLAPRVVTANPTRAIFGKTPRVARRPLARRRFEERESLVASELAERLDDDLEAPGLSLGGCDQAGCCCVIPHLDKRLHTGFDDSPLRGRKKPTNRLDSGSMMLLCQRCGCSRPRGRLRALESHDLLRNVHLYNLDLPIQSLDDLRDNPGEDLPIDLFLGLTTIAGRTHQVQLPRKRDQPTAIESPQYHRVYFSSRAIGSDPHSHTQARSLLTTSPLLIDRQPWSFRRFLANQLVQLHIQGEGLTTRIEDLELSRYLTYP